MQVEQQKQALVLRERNERAAADSGALSELQEVLDRERGRADELQVFVSLTFPLGIYCLKLGEFERQ